MSEDDVEPAAAAVLAGGWGDRTRIFRFALAAPAWTPLVACEAGAVVGTGLAAAQGPVGWVGVIWTAPASRGRGVGTAMTSAVADVLEATGCETLALIATDLGRPVYERLGFRAIGAEVMLRSSSGPERPAGKHPAGKHPAGIRIRPYESTDLDVVAALDREATGEDRGTILRAATDGWIAEARGTATGFLLCTPFGSGRGTVARGPATARALHRAADATSMDEHLAFPGRNEAGLAAMLESGWTVERRLTRMVRGPEPGWRPDRCFGDFSFATG
jgi:GNAT superfamily N-acetyltransferase